MTTASEAIGRRIRALREERGATADDVAEWARQAGLGWERSTVSSIEAGRRQVTVDELLLLPLVLTNLRTTASAPDVVLRDLLVEPIDLTAEVTVTADGLAALLAGDRLMHGDHIVLRSVGTMVADYQARWREEAVERIAVLWPGDRTASDVDAVLAATRGEAEAKTARALETTPFVLSAVAFSLWGRGLTAERNRRVDELVDDDTPTRSRQAQRGRVTRALRAELAAALEAKGVERVDLVPSRGRGTRRGTTAFLVSPTSLGEEGPAER